MTFELRALSYSVPIAAAAALALASGAAAQEAAKKKPIAIAEQGSFASGGTVIKNDGTFDPLHPTPDGQTLHGDHAYTFYQIPVDAKKLPLVMWHGTGQFSKTWESTPDGREGYQNIFLRRGFGVYLIDQPRRGDAGRTTVPVTVNATPDEQGWFGTFRLGVWPNFFKGVQFPQDKESLNQYWRQITPDTGPQDVGVDSDAVGQMFDKIGPAILVTHSASGGRGWATAIKSDNVKAIISYEPGSNFVFPPGEVPDPIPSAFDGQSLSALEVPLKDFKKLTKIPIIIYYGDNIPKKPKNTPGDTWRIRIEMAKLWAAAINKRGGDAQVVVLPDIGIKGNTHFPFSDLNNIEVANEMSRWLKQKRLDN